jgi:hypothetical protein
MEKEFDGKTFDEYWDHILNDTWSHNPWFEIMCELLYKKYPVERHESHADLWADPVVKSEEEMREIIEKIESYWKDKVRLLMEVVNVMSDNMSDYMQGLVNGGCDTEPVESIIKDLNKILEKN